MIKNKFDLLTALDHISLKNYLIVFFIIVFVNMKYSFIIKMKPKFKKKELGFCLQEEKLI